MCRVDGTAEGSQVVLPGLYGQAEEREEEKEDVAINVSCICRGVTWPLFQGSWSRLDVLASVAGVRRRGVR